MKLASDYKAMCTPNILDLAKHSDDELTIALGELLHEASSYSEIVDEARDDIRQLKIEREDLYCDLDKANERIEDLEAAIEDLEAAIDELKNTPNRSN